MEFNNLTTRTYTALTCKLIVSTKKTPASQSQRQSQNLHPPVDFTLYLDHPERGESERITLQGQFQQLDRLQQVVSKYITELVAKFPFPTMNNNSTAESSRSTTTERNQDLSTPELDTETSIGSKLYPSNDPQSTKSGLMNNLPGLRNSLNISNAASGIDPRSNSAATSGISKLFGGWNKQNSSKKSKAKQQHTPLGAAAAVQSGFGKREEVDDVSAAKSENHYALATPYLTGSERSLDRHLHLGDLANSASSDTITLSPIQLFDLSTVLDEYALEDSATNKQTESVTFSRTNIPGNQDRFVDPATVSLGRLPNLPKTAIGSQTSQVYNRTRRSSSSRSSVSFMSVIPWAAAAAVAVGVPLLLLDSKPNPLKDASSKVKMPDMEGVKKTVTAVMSPPIVDPEITNTPTDPTANPDLPKPWATQPVNPPQTKTNPIGTGTQPLQSSPTVNTGIQPIQTNSKPGIAPLPPTLDANGTQDLPRTTEIPGDNGGLGVLGVLPRDGAKSGIAPNPLSANQLPSIGSSGLRPLAKSGMKNTSPTTTANLGKTTELQRNKLSAAIKPGTVSVSTQPILLPSDLPGIGIDSSDLSVMPSTAQRPQKVKQKVKPIVAAKTSKQKTIKPIGASTVRQPLFDQSNLIPANPNFISPVQIPAATEGNDVQSLPIVPTQPFPTNIAGNWPGDSIDSPSLQEARTYFQSKWKASNTQANPLQYVVQINGKSGTVRSVSPQGEAATTYLKQTKLIKPGQKLVSPDAGGNDQKIRVVLQTDGNVDTFIEP